MSPPALTEKVRGTATRRGDQRLAGADRRIRSQPPLAPVPVYLNVPTMAQPEAYIGGAQISSIRTEN